MGIELGRISGPMLKENLTRSGIDLAFESDLLYLDVTNNKIGINTDGFSADLEINQNFKSTSVITENSQTISNLIFDANGSIRSIMGPIIFNPQGTDPVISFNRIRTENLEFSDSTISSLTTNSPIELIPNGDGNVEIYANTNIFGNLRATGNITLDGSITIGSDDSDSVEFLADIKSNIIPDQSSTHSFGTSQKQWSELHTSLANGLTVTAESSFIVAGVDFTLPQGNIWYVSISGNDVDNDGDHQDGSFLTVRKALSVATSGDTVYIYPGTYQEIFPLTVPVGVTLLGAGIRSVQITPTPATKFNDAFLLNGQTTVQNITIRDFFYDSISNTGYAFRFAPSTVISSRSPYVQNVTVITSGSVTSPEDPRGFNQGDAGRGALVDGSSVTSASIDASMLFYAATFITPNADALIMTNGVRVEWLNCFSYFANRGLYATQGSTGHTLPDGVTVRYGAELRSIGSASIYGNFGAVADGADTLMYLITHNFAYIGSGKDSSNDNTIINQLNEVVQLNLGQIRFNTQDQGGNYRVGDSFFVDFATGNTSFSVSDVSLLGLSSLRFTNNGSVTFIDAEKIETGNFRIFDNTILNVTDAPIIQSASGTIILNSDSLVQGNLSVTGNATIAGQVIFGNAENDSLSVFAQVTSNIFPDSTDDYDIGSADKLWNNSYLNKLDTGNIVVFNNKISTTESNSNLELDANGSGFIKISDLIVNQDIEITQSTSVADININTALSHSGDRVQTGDVDQVGDREIDGELTVINSLQLDQVRIDTNVITTVSGDLILETAGVGKLTIPENNTQVARDIEIIQTVVASTVNVTGNVSVSGITNNTILIDTNNIDTLSGNTDLILQANSVGQILVPSNSVNIVNNLAVTDISDLNNTVVTGLLSVTELLTISGNRTQIGSTDISGSITASDTAIFGTVKFQTNTITTTSGNLELDSSGTGLSIIPSNDVLVNGNISILGDTSFSSIDIINAISFAKATNNRIEIQGNYITGVIPDDDLILQAPGSARIYSSDTDFLINNNLTVDGQTSLTDLISSNINLNQLVHTGVKTQTGSLELSGSIFADDAVLSNIIATTNYISTTNGDLDLRAAGNGIVGIFSNDVIINSDISIIGQTLLAAITIGDNVQANKMTTSLMLIDDNFLEATAIGQDIELRANGTGVIYIPDSFVGNVNVTVSGSSSLSNIEIQGTVSHIGDTVHVGQRVQTGNLQTVNLTSSTYSSSGLTIVGNTILSEVSDLVLETSGTGKILVPENNAIIDNNLNVIGVSNVGILQSGNIVTNELFNENILIQDNFITTTVSNSNLELKANSGGAVWLTRTGVSSNIISSIDSDANIELTPFSGNNVVINKTSGLQVPVGTTLNRSALVQSDFRLNSTINNFEGFSTARRTFGGLFSADRNTFVLSESSKFANDNKLTFVTNNIVSMSVANNAMTLTGLTVDNDLRINNNQFSTLQSSSDINLVPNGAGQVQFTPKISIIGNELSNNATGVESVSFSSTGNGYVQFVGTNGIVIPFGTDADRIFQEIGEVRWNTQRRTIEIFDGNTYISAGGVGGITEEFMDELSNIYAIILG